MRLRALFVAAASAATMAATAMAPQVVSASPGAYACMSGNSIVGRTAPPPVGTSIKYTVTAQGFDAGTVTVERTGVDTLTVTAVNPLPGWTALQQTPPVRVRFTPSSYGSAPRLTLIVHFNPTGTKILERMLVTCTY